MNISKSEFKILLLIYGANVDYTFCKYEKTFIKALATTPEEFDRCMSLYNEHSEDVIFSILNDFIKKKETYSSKEMDLLTAELLDLFESDGIYSNFEKSFMAYFELVKTKVYASA